MATISSSETTIKGVLTRKTQPEEVEGADSTTGNILVPKETLDDASVTPKVTDWIDVGGTIWEIVTIKQDPMGAMYTFGVKDV